MTTTNHHPFDIYQHINPIQRRAEDLFNHFKTRLVSDDAREWVKLTVEEDPSDPLSIKVKWAGVTLCCVLVLHPLQAQGAAIEIYEVKRFEESPVFLEAVGFDVRTGASTKKHFPPTPGIPGETIYINTSHGSVELLAPYFFKALGVTA
jgi:hypothetical protein